MGLWVSLFAQRNHCVYSQASWAFTCPQVFIIIIVKEKGVVMQTIRFADV